MIEGNVEKNPKDFRVPNYAKQMIDALFPLQLLLTATGQYPIHKKYNPKSMTYEYSLKFYRPEAIISGLVIVFQAILIGLFGFNSFTIFVPLYTLRQNDLRTDLEKEEDNKTYLYEHVIVSRYRHSFITIWVNLICSFLGSFILLSRISFLTSYFGCWTRVATMLDLNCSRKLSKIGILMLAGYFFTFVVLFLMYYFKVSASLYGIPTLVSLMAFKVFTPDMLKFNDSSEYEIYVRSPIKPYIEYYRHAGAALYLIIFLWSKSTMLILIFYSKMLIQSFKTWNHRAVNVILKNRNIHKRRGKMSVGTLFRDHCILLDLVEGTDKVFAGIFELFIGLQISGLLHEIYYLFLGISRDHDSNSLTKSYAGNYFPRKFDIGFTALTTIQYLFWLIYPTRVAAEVGHEFMQGLEVIRRKTMIERTSDEELLFHFSMFQSFSGYDERCKLRCGGLFEINKSLLVGMLSTFLGFFIILQQFHPTFEYIPTFEGNDSVRLIYTEREKIYKFLFRFEGFPYCQYVDDANAPCPDIY